MMSNSLNASGPSRPNAFSLAMVLNIGGLAFALAAFAYVGTFARHIADDYCSIYLINGNFIAHLWSNYLSVSDRFSNFILIGASEALSPISVRALPGLLLLLWVGGLTWFLREASRVGGGAWTASLAAVLALLLVFSVILQAPNRYQTLYWRASSAAHVAPLVLMSFLAAWLSRLLRLATARPLATWVYPLVFLSAFFVGDFSEPTDAVMLVLIALALTVVCGSWKVPLRRRGILLLCWALGGAAAALLVMAVSPANAIRLHTAPPPLPVVLVRSFQYAAEFVLDMFRTRPLPTLLTFLTPILIFFLGRGGRPAPDRSTSRQRYLLLIATPLLVWILIAASFSPSVYGQGYPLERARIAGLFFLVVGVVTAGALGGTLAASWRARWPAWMDLVASLLLVLLAFYPVRAAWVALGEAEPYAQRAAHWDERQALILELKMSGETDLVVPQFGGLEGIKELDVSPDHWTNRCAAAYYGVESIRAIPGGFQ